MTMFFWHLGKHNTLMSFFAKATDFLLTPRTREWYKKKASSLHYSTAHHVFQCLLDTKAKIVMIQRIISEFL